MPCQEVSGVVRKTSRGWPSNSSKRALEICVPKKSAEPGLNALEFASFDGGFDLLEVGVPCADDHAIRRMLVQHLRELLQRGFSEAQFRHNFNAFFRSLFQFAPQPHDFTAGGDEDEAAFVLKLGKFAAQSPPHQLLFQIDQAETDAAKKHHHSARRQSGRRTSPAPNQWSRGKNL